MWAVIVKAPGAENPAPGALHPTWADGREALSGALTATIEGGPDADEAERLAGVVFVAMADAVEDENWEIVVGGLSHILFNAAELEP